MTARLPTQNIVHLEQAFESSSQLRVFKTKLTRTAGVLEHLANPQNGLSQYLKPADLAVLRHSIEVIHSVSLRVDQAKDHKTKLEASLEQAFNARQSQSWTLTKAFFPLEHATLEQQITGVCMALCLNQLGLLKPETTPFKFKPRLLNLAQALSKNFGSEYFYHELFSDCQQAIQEHISSPSTASVEKQLDELKLLIAERSSRLRQTEEAFIKTLTDCPPSQIVNGRSADASPARY